MSSKRETWSCALLNKVITWLGKLQYAPTIASLIKPGNQETPFTTSDLT